MGETRIEHKSDDKKFAAEIEGRESFLSYERRNGALDLKHTFVDEADRGGGVAADLVDTALRFADENDLKVVPSCSYVETYIERHPEWKKLTKEDSSSLKHAHERSSGKLKQYWPVVLLVLYSGWLGGILSLGAESGLREFMHYFMGAFLIGFSFFKLLDLKGFQESYGEYDLIAARYSQYGWFYPFIELALGSAFITFFLPVVTYSLTALIMAVSSAGVIAAVFSSKKDLQCACMGTVLDVPLSSVAIFEDVAMLLMSLTMLFLI